MLPLHSVPDHILYHLPLKYLLPYLILIASTHLFSDLPLLPIPSTVLIYILLTNLSPAVCSTWPRSPIQLEFMHFYNDFSLRILTSSFFTLSIHLILIILYKLSISASILYLPWRMGFTSIYQSLIV